MLNQWRLVMVFDPTVRGKSLTCKTSSSKLFKGYDLAVRGKSLTCRRSCMVFDLRVRGKSLTCRTRASKLLRVYDLQVSLPYSSLQSARIDYRFSGKIR